MIQVKTDIGVLIVAAVVIIGVGFLIFSHKVDWYIGIGFLTVYVLPSIFGRKDDKKDEKNH